jgi:hypothetical protein
MSRLRTRALWTKLTRLESHVSRHQRHEAPPLHALREDPARLLLQAGLAPDPWQERLLRAPVPRALLLCSRQAGKSTTAAALALRAALLGPPALVLVLSPSQRQSGELFRKVLDLFAALGRPVGVTAESALRLELSNGSRVVALPGDEKNIRCFSGVALLVIDEAARVTDALYYAVRPMLAVSQGQLVALSTPFGKRGWFHDEWHGEGAWERVKITASECPRIPADFLAEERKALGERWFRQEYECSFEDTVAAVFAYEDIQAALSSEVQPWFAEEARG